MKRMDKKIKKCFLIVFTCVLLLQNIQSIQAVNALRIVEMKNQVGPYFNVDVTENEPVNNEPTDKSTTEETEEPIDEETNEPTEEPIVETTIEPTPEPTIETTMETTPEPSVEPTLEPSIEPTPIVTDKPQITEAPVVEMTEEPVIEETPIVSDENNEIILEFSNTDTQVPDFSGEGFSDGEMLDEKTTVYTSESDPTLKKFVSGAIRNYEVEAGKYEEINTTLTPSISTFSLDDKSYLVQNTTNIIKSYYPSTLTEGIVLEREDVKLTIIPQLTQISEVALEGSQLIYPLENKMNLRYTVMPGWIEEEIVLYEKPTTNSFSSLLTIENGVIEQGDENGLVVTDSNHQLSMLIRAPKAFDAKGEKNEIKVSYENGIATYSVDEDWLMSDERQYPIVIDPNYFGYAHNGTDVTVSKTKPTQTLGNPDMEASGWVLRNHDDGYMFIGNHPRYEDSYSFYKINDDMMNSVLKGNYIKNAKLILYQGRTLAGTLNELMACNIPGTYDITKATYLNMPTNYDCFSADWTWNGSWEHIMDITPYVKSVAEDGASNNGILLTLRDPLSTYLEIFAGEYYYINGTGADTPHVEAEYYENPEIMMEDVDGFTYNLRPFVQYNYDEGLVHLTAIGFDGLAPYRSNVTVNVKNNGETVFTQVMEADDNFYRYPDYPVIEDAQQYTEKTSNYQTSTFFDTFEPGNLYTVEFQAKKGNDTSTIKSTQFRVYEVKGFDLISSIATFYGVSVETLMQDNNLQDELITEGNILFIRDPKRNTDVDYEEEDLSTDQKKQIDTSLRGRDIECEFGFEPINLNTGNFYLESSDISLNIRDEEFVFGRLYNSSAANNLSIFGFGWTYTGLARIASDQQGVTVQLEDGSKYYFELNEDGSYQNDLTNEYTLVYQDEHFVLSNKEQTWHFNHHGMIDKIIERNSDTTNYTYENQLLQKITFKDGKSLSFEYNEDLLVSKVSLDEEHFVTYEYDENLNLVKFTDPAGKTIEYTYAENHDMLSWINQNGKIAVENTYDDQHRVIYQIDGEDNEIRLEYFNSYTQTTDARGYVEKIYFDEFGQTTRIIRSDQQEVIYDFEKGLLMSKTLENNVTTTYTYDEHENLLTETRSDGYRIAYTYDENDNLINYVDSEGRSESWTYDDKNNMTSHTDKLGATTTYQYNSDNLKVKEIDALNNETTYEYDENQKLSKVSYPNGQSYQYTYNEAGYLTSTIDEKGNVTTHVLNARNEIIETHHADGGVIKYEYDDAGNRIKETDARGISVEKTYDLRGNVLTQKDGNGNVTVFEYDGNQNLVKQTLANGSVTSWIYDSRNRITSVNVNGNITNYTYNGHGVETETDGHGNVKTYEYDAIGNVRKITDIDGKVVLSTYDKYGNGLTVTDKAGNVLTNTYNANNQVLTSRNSLKTLEYEMDILGRVITEKAIAADEERVVTKTYDSIGQLLTVTDANGNVTENIYDGENLIKQIDSLGNETVYEYDSMGRKVKETTADGKVRTWTYDYNGNILTATDSNNHTTTYTYDGNNNCISVTNAKGNRTTFEFDSQNQVIKTTSPLGNVITTVYDVNGNPVQNAENGQVLESYTYDVFGNMTSKTVLGQTTTYEYNHLNQLVKETSNTGLVTTYVYDGLNRLVDKKVQDTVVEHFVYDTFDRIIETTDAYGETTEITLNGFDEEVEITSKGITSTYEYDSNGNPIVVEDSLGNVTENTYNERNELVSSSYNDKVTTTRYDLYGHVVQVTNPLGHSVTSTYDGEGNPLTTTANGHTTEMIYDEVDQVVETKVDGITVSKIGYDADQRVIKQIDGLGNTTQIVYNDLGVIKMQVDALGYATKFEYDQHQNLISITDAKNNKERYEYNDLNQQVKLISREGNVTLFEYDLYGNIVRTVYPNGAEETSKYNAVGQLVKQISVSGLETAYTYNSFNLPLTITQNSIIQSDITYNSLGQKVSEKDALENTTTYQYDKEGNLIKKTNALGKSQLFEYDELSQLVSHTNENGVETITTYDEAGNVLTETVSGRLVSTKTYNGFNQVVSETNGLGKTTTYQYDLAQRLVKVIDPLGNETVTEYNEVGKPVATIDANGNKSELIYDEVYNIVQQKNALGNLTTFTFNKDGVMTSTQNAKGYKVNYEVDEMGNVKRQYTSGFEVEFVYDDANRLIKITDEDGKSEQLSYDVFGNVLSMTQKSGTKITYTYDKNHNQLSSNDVLYQYDELNRLVEMTDKYGTTQYTYDNLGNIIKIERDENVIRYEYDDWNNQTKMIYPNSEVVTSTYDEANQLIAVHRGNSHYNTYEYDDAGRMIKETQCTGSVLTRTYDKVGNVLTQSTKTGNRAMSSYIYEYDRNNSVTKQTEVLQGKTTVKEFTYDENDELIKTVTTANGQATTKEVIISLDGNKVERTDGTNTFASVYNEMNQLTLYNDGENVIEIRYDTNGNRISEERDDGAVKRYEYDEFGYLSKVIDFDNTVITYQTDGHGNRIGQTVDRSQTDYNLSPSSVSDSISIMLNKLKETESTIPPHHNEPTHITSTRALEDITTIEYINDETKANAEVLAKVQDGQTTNYWYGLERVGVGSSYYQYDGLGNVNLILNTNLSVVVTYQYSDYGERDKKYNPFNSQSDEYGYRAEAHNVDGTQYLRARVYDPHTEVFISADTNRGTLTDLASQNRYNYAQNNPYKYRDSNGKAAVRVDYLGGGGGGTSGKGGSSKPKPKPEQSYQDYISSNEFKQAERKRQLAAEKARQEAIAQQQREAELREAARQAADYQEYIRSNAAKEEAARRRREAEEARRRAAEEELRRLVNNQSIDLKEFASSLFNGNVNNAVESLTLQIKNTVDKYVELKKKYPDLIGSLENKVHGFCDEKEQVGTVDEIEDNKENINSPLGIYNDFLGVMIEGTISNSGLILEYSIKNFEAMTSVYIPTYLGIPGVEKLVTPIMVNPLKNIIDKLYKPVEPLKEIFSKSSSKIMVSYGVSVVLGTTYDILTGEEWYDAIVDNTITIAIAVPLASGATAVAVSFGAPVFVGITAGILVSSIAYPFIEAGYTWVYENVPFADKAIDGVKMMLKEAGEFVGNLYNDFKGLLGF